MEIDLKTLRETAAAKQRERGEETRSTKKAAKEQRRQAIDSKVASLMEKIPGLLERAAREGKTAISVAVGIGDDCASIAGKVASLCCKSGLFAEVKMSKFAGSDESPEVDSASVEIDFAKDSKKK